MSEKLGVIQVLYLADHFYNESGSAMSPIYLEDGRRYDWGFLQRDLARGYEVHIRQATDEEYGRYARKLRAMKEKATAQGVAKDG